MRETLRHDKVEPENTGTGDRKAESNSALAAPRFGAFLEYLDRVHERTRRVVMLMPPADVEWAPTPHWFTFGGLVRHLAAIERWMFAENALGRPSRYPGQDRQLADGYEAVLAYYDRLHALERKVTTPSGAPITLWKWMRSMGEHEAHHRGQLYLMLAMRGVSTPPLYGLTSEEVRARSLGPTTP